MSNTFGSKASQTIRTFPWRKNTIYIAFILTLIFFSITLGDLGFNQPSNLLNIARQCSSIAVMAVMMTFVIATAEIDLSVGSVAGLSSVIAANALQSYGLVIGVAAGLSTGLVLGIITGLLVAVFKVPSFLVTLGMLGLVEGGARWYTSSLPVAIGNSTFNSVFGGGQVGPIPGLLFWSLGATFIGAFVLNHTKFGRQVLATGGSLLAAKYTGVNTARIKFTVLVGSGVCASLAGLLYAGRLESGRFQWGQGDALSVIAAVILGGTSLFGGRGAVFGSFVGAFFIGLVNNGLILAGLDVSQQQVVQGAIIVIAVILSRKD
jgi:ribose transport system permease protein